MSDFHDSAIAHTTGTPRWVGLAVAVLGGISLLSLGIGWSALNQARGIEQNTQASLKQSNDALTQRLAKEDEIYQQLQSDVKVVTDKLNVTHLATSVKAELATKANSDDVNRLNGDVTGVKSDLDATKNSIQMARSEMGTLIARNR